MASNTLQVLVNFAVKGKEDLRGASSELQKIDGVAKGGGASLKQYGLAIAGVAAGLAGVAAAGKVAWDTLRDAATIEFTASKFDRLAASIGSTSDAMLQRLRNATSGMVNDLELMASASELVSLGLTKTEDETVRLASVAGQLNWNMQQVVLTLANMSTMRLDALGLSVEDVTGRAKELEAAGMAAQEAFKLAVIEAGEAKLGTNAIDADSTLADIMRLETAWDNFVTGAKTAFLNVVVSGNGVELLNNFTDFFNMPQNAQGIRSDIEQAMANGLISQRTGAGLIGEMGPRGRGLEWVAAELDRIMSQVRPAGAEFANDMERAAAGAAQFTDAMRQATSGYGSPITVWSQALADVDAAMAGIEDRWRAQAQIIQEAEFARGADFAALIGGDMIQDANQTQFNQMLYDRAVAAGLATDAIIALGLELGQFNEAQVVSTQIGTELDKQIENLANKQSAGLIDMEQFIAQAQELYGLAQAGDLGALIGASIAGRDMDYGAAALGVEGAIQDYLGQDVTTIDFELESSAIDDARSALEDLGSMEITPYVSLGGPWAEQLAMIQNAGGGGGGVPGGTPGNPLPQGADPNRSISDPYRHRQMHANRSYGLQ